MRSNFSKESIINIGIQYIFEQQFFLYGYIDNLSVSFVRWHEGTYKVHELNLFEKLCQHKYQVDL